MLCVWHQTTSLHQMQNRMQYKVMAKTKDIHEYLTTVLLNYSFICTRVDMHGNMIKLNPISARSVEHTRLV